MCVAGYRRHAELLMSSFTWGSHFLDLNKRFLDLYVSVPTGQAMKKLKEQQEEEMLREKQKKERQKAAGDAGYSSVYRTIEVSASTNEA